MLNRFYILTLFALLSFSILGAQTTDPDRESRILYLFEKSKEYATTKQYQKAISSCREILSMDSINTDAAVLLGRVYLWSEKYDSSAIILSQVLKSNPSHFDALEAMCDNEFAAGRVSGSIDLSRRALEIFPDNKIFTAKLNRAEIKLKTEKRSNRIHIQFWSDVIEDNQPWFFGSVTYTKKFKKAGSVSLRYNYANRFNRTGHQLEADAYPVINKSIYLYLNAGISNSINFPFLRAAVEPYFKLPAGFEASAGVRYMSFEKQNLLNFGSGKVLIITGTIGKYAGNWWFSVRPYFSYSDREWSSSATLTARRYFSDADSFLSANFGTGFSPDLQQYAFDQELEYLKSNRILLEYQQKFSRWYIINLSAGYAREELQSSVSKNRFTFIAGFTFIL